MAYVANTWRVGDRITAEKLNHLEQGVQNEQIGPQGPQGPKGDTGETGAKGDKGDTGVGIKTITGTIDSSNKLSLTFTLTDESTQKVEGTITILGE